MKKNQEVHIDIRPPYAFAFHEEGMSTKDMLFYSKKDKSLHFKHKASFLNYMNEMDEDREYRLHISDEEANNMKDVFKLIIKAYNAFLERNGDEWCVLDGSECTVICWHQRVRFDTPFSEPFTSFYDLIIQTLYVNEEREKPDYAEFKMQIPMVKEKLINYLYKG